MVGTAFFVTTPSESDPSIGYPCTVTAKHTLDRIKEKYGETAVTFLKVNIQNGPVVNIEVAFDQWLYHPTDVTADVAVMQGALNTQIFDHRFIHVQEAATREKIEEHKIGLGDEVFITGLFSYHYGTSRMIPIVRVGNISLMPGEPVQSQGWGNIEAYLIEARSIGGLSGSPVFVNLSGVRFVDPSQGLGGIRFGPPTAFCWLGLVHGHWDATISELDTTDTDALRHEKMNTGIAIVVPVSKILEVINQDELVKRRRQEDANRGGQAASEETPRGVSPEPA